MVRERRNDRKGEQECLSMLVFPKGDAKQSRGTTGNDLNKEGAPDWQTMTLIMEPSGAGGDVAQSE